MGCGSSSEKKPKKKELNNRHKDGLDRHKDECIDRNANYTIDQNSNIMQGISLHHNAMYETILPIQNYKYYNNGNNRYCSQSYFLNGIIKIQKGEILAKYMEGFPQFVGNFIEGLLDKVLYVDEKKYVYFYQNKDSFKLKTKEYVLTFIFSYPDCSMFHGRIISKHKLIAGVFSFKTDPIDKRMINIINNENKTTIQTSSRNEYNDNTEINEIKSVNQIDKEIYVEMMRDCLLGGKYDFSLIYGKKIKGSKFEEGYFHKNKLIQQQTFDHHLYNKYKKIDQDFDQMLQISRLSR